MMKKGGFTLIELMVVVAIIGFIAAIAMPNFVDITKDAQIAQIQGNEKNLQTALNMYVADTGNDVGDLFGEDGGIDHVTDGKYGDDITKAMDSEFEPFYRYFSKNKLPHLPNSKRWRAIYVPESKLHGSEDNLFDSEAYIDDEEHYGWIFTDKGNVYPLIRKETYGIRYDEFI